MIDKNSKIIAIRSLQSQHHATNLPPSIVTINWNIGKRCNFDCSYCTPHHHDAVSPHMPVDRAFAIVEHANHAMKSRSKLIEWWITGGEPFLNPNIHKIFEKIKNSDATKIVGVTTNGSLPLAVYLPSLEHLNNLTISLHLEQDEKKIADILNTAREIKRQFPALFLSISIMFLPGRQQQVKDIMSYLKSNDIDYAILRINPNSDGKVGNDDVTEPGKSRRDTSLRHIEIQQQFNLKKDYFHFRDQKLEEWIKKYYSEQDLEFLSTHAKASFNNMAVWLDDGSYVEINCDDISNMRRNKFFGWKCYSGTDCFFIGINGHFYNATCLLEDLGSPETGINWPSDGIICSRRVCTSQPDVAVRKCLPGNDSLIQN